MPTAVLAGLLVSGCSDDPQQGIVTLRFSHNVDGAVVAFRDSVYTNAAGDSWSIVRLDYLISNVALVASNGTQVFFPGPFFIDAEDDGTLSKTLYSIPPGTYEKIHFTFGLDETMNLSNAYLAESWHGKMSWPEVLGGGYHYMILDGFVDPGPTQRSYNTHLGRTQTDPHYFWVQLNVTPFTVDGNMIDVPVSMDVAQWYEAPNVYSFPDPAFIMDRPDVQDLLQENGGSVFSSP